MTPTDLETLAEFLTLADAYLKAATPRVPTYNAILDAALHATGMGDAYRAGDLDGRQALDLLHAVRLEGRRWLRAQAEALLEDVAPDTAKALFGSVRAKVGAFFGRAKQYVRELFAAGVLAVAGPDTSVLRDPVVQTAMAEQVSEQMMYMDAFEDRIVSEARPLGPAFAANAEQYGSAVWGGTQNTIRKATVKSGVFSEERRIHLGPRGVNDPCNTCTFEENKGWVPIGTLKSIGQSECKTACHCTFAFRVDANGPEYFAGRGPLWEPAFGRTG